MTTHELEYQYSDEFVRLVSWRFLWKYAGVTIFLSAFLFVGSMIALVRGARGPLVWICIAVPFVYFVVWLRYFQRAGSVAKSMKDRSVRVTMADEAITFSTAEHTSTMKWSRLREVWLFRDVCLLFAYGVGAGSYTAIPTAIMSADTHEYLTTRLREAGAKIVQG